MENLEHICQQIQQIAKQAGQYIREQAAAFDASRIEYKGLNDMVSYVDKGAETMIVEVLSKIIPLAGFIAEEGSGGHYDAKNGMPKGDWWIIDPLDGTTNFIHSLPVYAVSIALLSDGVLQAGVVYEINRNECFCAWKGGGAWLNGQPITISKAPNLSQSLIATGFPYYDFGRTEDYLKIFQSLITKTHGLRRFGSAATDLAYTACGRFDGFYEHNLKTWDMAAGALLVLEAGGQITDFQGGQDWLFGGNVLAALPNNHEEMLETIMENWK